MYLSESVCRNMSHHVGYDVNYVADHIGLSVMSVNFNFSRSMSSISVCRIMSASITSCSKVHHIVVCHVDHVGVSNNHVVLASLFCLDVIMSSLKSCHVIRVSRLIILVVISINSNPESSNWVSIMAPFVRDYLSLGAMSTPRPLFRHDFRIIRDVAITPTPPSPVVMATDMGRLAQGVRQNDRHTYVLTDISAFLVTAERNRRL